MDLNFLQNSLRESLTQFHLSPTIRYKNIAFSSKKLSDLDDVTQTLRSLLPGYSVWQNPGRQGAPKSISSRQTLLHCISDIQQEGVIIHQPEQWSSHWPLLEKQAFWSALGMWQSQINVVLVFAESDEFQQINNAYFKPKLIDGLTISVWCPMRAEQ
ncbi:MAG: hypothetical protein M0R33_21385 [Methylomonas sp.]|uniref:hypothetical protein n=1 Tax=Methylomonas sp. TaxID=418 RepID=UPI0025F8D6C3|nr:hypothetical protein [Methylomonas sp.]MCK9608998.1 hypothetical protein [Methylomonas sp.]